MTSRITRPGRLLVAPLLLYVAAAVTAQDAPAPDTNLPAPKSKAAKKAPRRPAHRDTGRTYMGRDIADVMTYLGADWLVRPEREEEERPEDMIDALKLKPTDVVADVGAGVGYTSMRLARRVPRGKVLATDIQPQMIRMLRDNIRRAGVKNVEPILCTQAETKLPDSGVDLAVLVDVYHEASDPEALLKGLHKALKTGGRLVLVEFRGEDPEVPIKPEHKMTVDQVRKEIEPQGFTLKSREEFLPWQHLLIFEKVSEEAGPKAKAAEKKKSDEDD